MSPPLPQQVLRKIPKVDEILSRSEITDLLKVHPRAVVLEAIRKGLNTFRENLLRREKVPPWKNPSSHLNIFIPSS